MGTCPVNDRRLCRLGHPGAGRKRLGTARGEVGRKRWRGVQGVHEVSRGDREEGSVEGRAHLSRCFVPGQDAIWTVGDK